MRATSKAPTRFLLITTNLPFPSFSGHDLRAWRIAAALGELGEVGVFALCKSAKVSEQAPAGMALWRWSGDAELQYPPSGRRLEARAWFIQPETHPWDFFYSSTAAQALEDTLADFAPQVAVVESAAAYRYVEVLHRHGCIVVADSHNIEALLAREIAAAMTGEHAATRLVRRLLPERTAVAERHFLRAADQIWVCSQQDAALLQSVHAPAAPVRVVHNTVDTEALAPTRTARAGRTESGTTILFPASFAYPPNAAAADFLIAEIFPPIARRLPGARLQLAGCWPTAAMREAARADRRIEVTGAVADMRPFFRDASLLIAPLTMGSGTRLKIIEAFAAGIPVVSTPKGCEGLAVTDGIHLLLGDSGGALVEAILRLHRDPALERQLVARALRLAETEYSSTSLRRQIEGAVAELRRQPAAAATGAAAGR